MGEHHAADWPVPLGAIVVGSSGVWAQCSPSCTWRVDHREAQPWETWPAAQSPASLDACRQQFAGEAEKAVKLEPLHVEHGLLIEKKGSDSQRR